MSTNFNEAKLATTKWPWTLNVKGIPTWSAITPSLKFQLVLLREQPLWSYRPIWDMSTEWPQHDIETRSKIPHICFTNTLQSWISIHFVRRFRVTCHFYWHCQSELKNRKTLETGETMTSDMMERNHLLKSGIDQRTTQKIAIKVVTYLVEYFVESVRNWISRTIYYTFLLNGFYIPSVLMLHWFYMYCLGPYVLCHLCVIMFIYVLRINASWIITESRKGLKIRP